MLATESPESLSSTGAGVCPVSGSFIVETETCGLLSRLFLWKKEEMPEHVLVEPVLSADEEAGQLVSFSSWLSAAELL